MHVKAKKIAFGGMLLALTIIFMMLGSIIETGTLFLLAAASFFVGIIWREFGAGSGVAFWGVKYVVFNLIFLPAVLLFQEVLFVREISGWMSVIVIAAGQVFLFLYDRAYEYFQGVLWNKMRGRFLN